MRARMLGGLVLLAIFLLYKEFVVVSFDPIFAATLRLHRPGALRLLGALLAGLSAWYLVGVLVERLKFMDKSPRLALTWGTCRKPRKRLARKVPPPPPAR